jgi:hypothetical protein
MVECLSALQVPGPEFKLQYHLQIFFKWAKQNTKQSDIQHNNQKTNHTFPTALQAQDT